MTYTKYIYEIDEDGHGIRCHFGGMDWFVVVECSDGRRAASSAPDRLDAVTKARMKLGMPIPKAGPKMKGEPMPDPVAILDRAVRERNAALRALVSRALPSWEWGLGDRSTGRVRHCGMGVRIMREHCCVAEWQER